MRNTYNSDRLVSGCGVVNTEVTSEEKLVLLPVVADDDVGNAAIDVGPASYITERTQRSIDKGSLIMNLRMSWWVR